MDRFWGDSVGACIPGYCDTGQDEIHARDGSQETINCGPGTDSAVVDNSDIVVQQPGETDQCESVDGAGSGGPGGGSGGRAGIVVTYAAPRAGRIRARGIAIINNRLTQVASASRRVRHRGRVKMTLTISAAANRVLKVTGRPEGPGDGVVQAEARPRQVASPASITLHPVG